MPVHVLGKIKGAAKFGSFRNLSLVWRLVIEEESGWYLLQGPRQGRTHIDTSWVSGLSVATGLEGGIALTLLLTCAWMGGSRGSRRRRRCGTTPWTSTWPPQGLSSPGPSYKLRWVSDTIKLTQQKKRVLSSLLGWCCGRTSGLESRRLWTR